jgi:hypothetical protein
MKFYLILSIAIILNSGLIYSQKDFIRDNNFNAPKNCIGNVHAMTMLSDKTIFFSHGGTSILCTGNGQFDRIARLNLSDGSFYNEFRSTPVLGGLKMNYIDPYIYFDGFGTAIRFLENGDIDTNFVIARMPRYTGDFLDYSYLKEIDRVLISGGIYPFDFGMSGAPFYQRRPFFWYDQSTNSIDTSFRSPITHDDPDMNNLERQNNYVRAIHVDYTRKHIYFCPPSKYADGHYSENLFRMDYYGNIDTTFSLRFDDKFVFIYEPRIATYVAMDDGSILVGGAFLAYHEDKLIYTTLIKLDSTGKLDSTFNYYNNIVPRLSESELLESGFIPRLIHKIVPWKDSLYIIGGQFRSYQGVDKGNMVVIDKNGQIQEEYFTGEGFSRLQNNPNGERLSYVNNIIKLDNDTLLVSGVWNFYNGERYIEGVLKLVFSDINTSTQEHFSIDHSVRIFPNPTSYEITIDLGHDADHHGGVYHLILRDMQGKEVGSFPISPNSSTIRVDYLNQGMYVAQVYDAQSLRAVGKFVVKR